VFKTKKINAKYLYLA